MTTDRHAALLARYDEANLIAQQTRKLNRAAETARHELALALMDLEGRGHLPAAAWVRAHLADNHAEAERISRKHPSTYWDDEPRRVLPPQRSPLPVLATVQCQCCGRPAQVCVCEEAPQPSVYEHPVTGGI